MNTKLRIQPSTKAGTFAFTLAELCVAVATGALLFSGIVVGFVQSAQRAEWNTYNLSAQSLAQEGVEQARAAKWDPAGGIDLCLQTNFPPVVTNIIDIPITDTNLVYATNTWTITTFNNGANYPYKMIKVDCTWAFQKQTWGCPVFTNTVATIRAPDGAL